MAGDIYVLGGWQSDFAQNWQRNGRELFDAFRDTVTAGLDAVQLEPQDIEVAHVGNFAAEVFCGQGHLGGFFAASDPQLAGVPAVGVLSELMNDDGTVMRGPAVRAFAEKHGLKFISIADLISYRQARDKLVERIGTFQVPTDIGTLTGYAYMTPFDKVHHLAFVYGNIEDGENVLARLHRADVIGDVFGGAKTVHATLQRFKKAGQGVLVYLRDGAAGVPVVDIPHGDTTGTEAARSQQWREIGVGAQILQRFDPVQVDVIVVARQAFGPLIQGRGRHLEVSVVEGAGGVERSEAILTPMNMRASTACIERKPD